MVWKKAGTLEFFQQGEKAIINDRIRNAGDANLVEVLGGLKLSKSDWIVSKNGRNLVIPTAQVKVIEGIKDISTELEPEHIVETRGIGIGRKINDKIAIVEEIITPSPDKILATNEACIQIIKKALLHGSKKAVDTLREKERSGSVRDIIFNNDVNSVDELLNKSKDWELISSRERTRLMGKLWEKVKSTPRDKLLLDIHTHDKVVPESDVPTTQDYIAVRSAYKFDWFGLCRSTNIESMKSPNLMDDTLFFYVGKGSKPFLTTIRELKKIKDEDKRFDALYELRFDIYHSLRADIRTYGQILDSA